MSICARLRSCAIEQQLVGGIQIDWPFATSRKVVGQPGQRSMTNRPPLACLPMRLRQRTSRSSRPMVCTPPCLRYMLLVVAIMLRMPQCTTLAHVSFAPGQCTGEDSTGRRCNNRVYLCSGNCRKLCNYCRSASSKGSGAKVSMTRTRQLPDFEQRCHSSLFSCCSHGPSFELLQCPWQLIAMTPCNLAGCTAGASLPQVDTSKTPTWGSSSSNGCNHGYGNSSAVSIATCIRLGSAAASCCGRQCTATGGSRPWRVRSWRR